LFCFLSYGVVLILGAQAHFRTTETQIYAEFFKGESGKASILALLQLLVTIAIVLGYLFYIRKKTQREKTGTTEVFPQEAIKPKQFFKKPGNVVIIGVLLLGLALEIAPMIAIIVNSFWDPYLGQFVNTFKELFSSETASIARIGLGSSILNTLKFAFGSAIFASLLSIITVAALGERRSRKSTVSLEMLTYLPLAISSVTLSLGITQTFIGSNFFANNPWIFIIISQGLRANSAYKFYRIYLPLLLRSFLAGFAFALGLSIGEFTTAIFFSNINPGVTTLTVVLYRLRNARMFGPASAIGVILMIVSYGSFFILELLGSRERTISRL